MTKLREVPDIGRRLDSEASAVLRELADRIDDGDVTAVAVVSFGRDGRTRRYWQTVVSEQAVGGAAMALGIRILDGVNNSAEHEPPTSDDGGEDD